MSNLGKNASYKKDEDLEGDVNGKESGREEKRRGGSRGDVVMTSCRNHRTNKLQLGSA